MSEIAQRVLLPSLPSRAEATAAAVEAIEAAVVDRLDEVDQLDQLTEWLDAANALTEFLRSRELHGPMQGAARHVEGRIGQLLGEAPGRGRAEMNRHAHSFSPDLREDFRLLARGSSGQVDVTTVEWRTSRRALVQLIKKRIGYRDNIELPDGIYSTIVADPPWKQSQTDTWGDEREGSRAGVPYRTMSLEDIKLLPVSDRAAEHAHLYLWTTNHYLENAFEVVRAWGFAPSTTLTWCKTPRGIGLGGAYTITTEYVIYARKGSLEPLERADRSWFTWPRREHSVKPGEFYDLVESVSPGPYLDLFAREPRDGWTTWGDEL